MTTQQINSKKFKIFLNFEIFAVGEPGSNVSIFSWFLVFGICLPKRTLLQTYKTKKKKFFCMFLSQPTDYVVLGNVPSKTNEEQSTALFDDANAKKNYFHAIDSITN